MGQNTPQIVSFTLEWPVYAQVILRIKQCVFYIDPFSLIHLCTCTCGTPQGGKQASCTDEFGGVCNYSQAGWLDGNWQTTDEGMIEIFICCESWLAAILDAPWRLLVGNSNRGQCRWVSKCSAVELLLNTTLFAHWWNQNANMLS